MAEGAKGPLGGRGLTLGDAQQEEGGASLRPEQRRLRHSILLEVTLQTPEEVLPRAGNRLPHQIFGEPTLGLSFPQIPSVIAEEIKSHNRGPVDVHRHLYKDFRASFDHTML